MLKISGAVLSAALLVTTFAATPAKAAIQIAASDNNGASFSDISGIFGTGVVGAPFLFADGKSGISISAAGGIGAPISTGLTLFSGEIAIDGKKGDHLIIALSDNGYNAPTGLADLTDQLSTTDSAGVATFGLKGYQDNSDNLFATTTGTPGGALDSTANAAAPLSVIGEGVMNGSSGPFTFAAPYSLTEIASITFNTKGYVQAGFTAQLNGASVPEPASIVLFGTILAGACFVVRRRQANS